jgi:hypothetical protein
MAMSPQEVSDALAGERVLSVKSHPMSGVMIDLGEWRRRQRHVNNDKLTEQERNFEGSHSLFLRAALTLYGRRSAMLLDGKRPEGDDVWLLLDQLVGCTLLKAEFVNPLLELRLDFNNDFCIYVETVESAPGAQCYSIALDDIYWTVCEGGRIEEEPRQRYLPSGEG